MSLHALRTEGPGETVILSGNEAIARGALEAGLAFAAAYPGSPSSEVLGSLGALARELGFYAEWSTNEKVAMESAAAASFAGLRAMTIMKADGMNVALDFMTSLAYSGVKGGLVIVVSDDPGAHSSTKEEDTRYLVRAAHLPVLEASTVEEAKEMTRWAFELSEAIALPVVVRSVTRIAHARGSVRLGALVAARPEARYDLHDRFLTNKAFHEVLHSRLADARERFERSPFNGVEGPAGATRVIVAAGPGVAYAREAVRLLGATDEVRLVKLGTTWPLPERFVATHLAGARHVLFLEEIEPFIESEVKSFWAQHADTLGAMRFLGKASGHVAGPGGPAIGELTPEIVLAATGALTGRAFEPRSEAFRGQLAATALPDLPPRALSFCPGCPHRASFWAIKVALELDGRKGVVLGDIGCYTLGAMQTGYFTLRTVHAMGSGAGLASGFGKLDVLGFTQPVVAVVGDSTFYHAVIPALVNARYNESPVLVVVVDNGTTAMTGHQPHPGTGRLANGEVSSVVPIEALARGLGIPTEIQDPIRVDETVDSVYRLLQTEGAKLLILRSPCALLPTVKRRHRAWVDPARCIGEKCGCGRFCTRTFSCPALIWDAASERARVDDVLCAGCGVCVDLCPRQAIELHDVPLVPAGR
jgi:indolepyruvate ferredoxin oxidoreductase alpha subunit